MELKIKFVVVVSNGTIQYQGETFRVIVEKITAFTWKEAKKIAKELKEIYPKNKVVIKEKFKEGWKIVATKN